MGKSENIIRFDEALKNDPEKQKAFEASLQKSREKKSVKSDGEAIQKAAKELGFDLSIEELERFFAEKQEVADEDLDAVAGGKDSWCWADYYCFSAWHHSEETDEHVSCWSDYNCAIAYKHNFDCTEDYAKWRCDKDCM